MGFKTWVFDFLDKSPKKETSSKDIEGSKNSSIRNLEINIQYKELALYTAITLIANAISKCEFKILKKNESVKDKHYYILNVSSNKNQNSSQFWHKVVEKMIYDGEALVLDINDELHCADSFSIDKYPINGNIYKGVVVDGLQLNKVFTYKEILLFRLDNTHIKKFIDALNKDYGRLLSYAIKKYEESNDKKYKLKLEENKAGDEEFNKVFEEVVRAQLKAFLESDNAVYPEFQGYDLQDISPKSNVKDIGDIISLRKDIFEIVGQTLKIPSNLMLGNITNIQDVVNVFLTFCIDPIADMIGEELTRKVYSFEDWRNGCQIKVDTTTIKHIDAFDVAEKVDKLIASGANCIDEVRVKLDYPELNTEFGKTHFITKNYDTMENRLKGEEGVKNE